MDAFKETDMQVFFIVSEQSVIAIRNASLYTALQNKYQETNEKLQKLKKVIGEAGD